MLNEDLLTAPADVLILPMTDDLSHAVAFATACREKKVRAQLYTEPKKFKAKMNYANRIGVPFVALLGETEIEGRTVSIKNMRSGKQKAVPLEEAPDYVKERVKKMKKGTPINE